MRRALIAQHRAAVATQPRREFAQDAALADPGLAADQHHLSLTAPGAAPALEQQPDLVLAADELGQAGVMRRLEPAVGPGGAGDAPDRDRGGKALQPAFAAVLQHERSSGQSPGRIVDDHLAGLCQPLQPCRQVWRLAGNRAAFLHRLAHHVADHHLTGRNTGSRRQGLARALDRANRRRRSQRRADRHLGLVLMGLRPAEIGQHPVAEQLGHMPLMGGDDAGNRVVIAAHHLAQLLGVEFLRQFGRPDQIAEQHRELAPLGVRFGFRSCFWRFRFGRGGGQRRQQLAPVAQRQPQFLQIVVRKLWQDIEIDIVLGQNLRVLAQPQPLQPSLQIVHGIGPNRLPSKQIMLP